MKADKAETRGLMANAWLWNRAEVSSQALLCGLGQATKLSESVSHLSNGKGGIVKGLPAKHLAHHQLVFLTLISKPCCLYLPGVSTIHPTFHAPLSSRLDDTSRLVQKPAMPCPDPDHSPRMGQSELLTHTSNHVTPCSDPAMKRWLERPRVAGPFHPLGLCYPACRACSGL